MVDYNLDPNDLDKGQDSDHEHEFESVTVVFKNGIELPLTVCSFQYVRHPITDELAAFKWCDEHCYPEPVLIDFASVLFVTVDRGEANA